MQISRRVADLLLGMGGASDLKSLQQSIDAAPSPRSAELKDVEVAGNVAVKRTTAAVRNVLAMLPGTGEHADEYVVVGAHYDHLGTGQLGHMLGPVGSIYHGADDNASGTAALLEIAAQLKKEGPLPRSILFASKSLRRAAPSHPMNERGSRTPSCPSLNRCVISPIRSSAWLLSSTPRARCTTSRPG